MTGSLADRFKSGSQKAGNVTEAWGAENFYCPNCSSPKLNWLKAGTEAIDYRCPKCEFEYQLKSQRTAIRNSITDGAYGSMMRKIRNDETPNFYFLQYDFATWTVRNLLLVPYFAFPASAIIKRPPLAATARRAGWIGCNFDLSRIPAEARIEIIKTLAPHPDRTICLSPNDPHPAYGHLLPLPRAKESLPPGTAIAPLPKSRQASHRRQADDNSPSPWGEGRDEGGRFQTIIVPPADVRAQFKKVKPLKDISVKERGWTLDVLNVVAAVCDRRSLQTATTGAHGAGKSGAHGAEKSDLNGL